MPYLSLIHISGEFFIDVKAGALETQIREANDRRASLLSGEAARLTKEAEDERLARVQVEASVAPRPVSYTHLDVYKRQGQFVQDLFLFTKRLLDQGYDVMVSGLELDFRGMPFGEMLELSWLVRTYAGNVTELVAYCSCGAKALYPQRLVDGKPAHYTSPIIMAGDNYEPRCEEHFVLPGRPH